jgi:hypothetical protein
LSEVSCIQYGKKWSRTKDEAERIAVLKVFRLLRKRGFFPFIWLLGLSHRNSGHVHVAILTDHYDYRYICGCCKEAQKHVRADLDSELRYKTCDCGDCIACDPDIRMDMEMISRKD